MRSDGKTSMVTRPYQSSPNGNSEVEIELEAKKILEPFMNQNELVLNNIGDDRIIGIIILLKYIAMI